MIGLPLDPRLASGSLAAADLPLCQVRLQDDRRWPRIVLVPRRRDLVEIEDLAPQDRAQLLEEIVLAGRAVRRLGAHQGFEVEKLNVGALGNVVAKLHVHVGGRRRDDPAWPGPVWGVGQPVGYGAEAARLVEIIAAAFME